MEISTISECLLFSTVRIETFNKEDSYVGTGFVFEYKINEISALFLVTCKHVIKDMQRGSLTFTQARNGKPLIGTSYIQTIDDFEQLWFVHPDDDIDIAVTPFSSLLKFIAEDKGVDIFYISISSSMLPTEETIK